MYRSIECIEGNNIITTISILKDFLGFIEDGNVEELTILQERV